MQMIAPQILKTKQKRAENLQEILTENSMNERIVKSYRHTTFAIFPRLLCAPCFYF